MPHAVSVEKRFLELIEGQNVLVDCSDEIPKDQPSWYDAEKFKRGQLLFRHNYSGICLSNLCCLLVLLISPHVLKPLIFTRKSETPWKAFRRYVATVIHVKSWYLGDIWREGDPARKSIRKVKQYHSRAALMMNRPDTRPLVDKITLEDCGVSVNINKPLRYAIRADLKNIGNCPFADLIAGTSAKVYEKAPFVNQYEMAITQFAFLGLVLVYPHKFGIPSPRKEDLEGLVHFWRCVGYLLGIEDRFNFCNEDDLDFTRQLSQFTLDNLMKPSLKNFSAESEHMTSAIADGMRFYLPGYSFEGLFMYIFWVLDLDVPQFISRVELGNWIHCTILKGIYCYFSWVPGVIVFFNGVLKLALTLIVFPLTWWPRSRRPPHIAGLAEYWID